MPRAPSPFSQQDIARAIRGARAAGLVIDHIEIDRAGKIRMTTRGATEGSAPQDDELDEELRQFVGGAREGRT